MSRYLIGLDLGTTNSCVGYVDTDLNKNPSLSVQLFKIPQGNSDGHWEALSTLPSFCYLEDEKTVVGAHAKELGSRVPTRAVQSAKSWLCNGAAARRDRILPLNAASEEGRISPVEATTAYLRHIREQWNATIGKGDPEQEFEAQELVVTVPASFDEVARHLTIEAARAAGFQNMTLLEEPQAAFYDWIGRQGEKWKDELSVGDRVLVVDVGGGTTDFSLIDVVEGPALRRMSVGRHLLLGGDNMDEALSHLLEKKLGCKLDSGQWHQLRHEARRAKEVLLTGEERTTIVVQGSGSSLLGGSLTTDLTRDEALELLVGGFFGQYDLESARQLRKATGIRSIGLPYEEEPSIAKHLAAFLQEAPTRVLFNGGTMKPDLFRKAILDNIERWYGVRPEELPSHCLDLAVARGAAYFGKARNGLGTRIGGGLPRTYYLEVKVGEEEKALTILPRGTEEGIEIEPDKRFTLTPNAPVAFTLYSSETRLDDVVGDLVEVDEEQLHRLPPLHTVLRFGKRTEQVPIHLKVKLSEIGTLEIWLESATTDHKWQLEFQVRSATGQDDQMTQSEKRQADETFDAHHLDRAQDLLTGLFEGNTKPSDLMLALEEALQQNRQEWPPSLLRGLFDQLLPLAEKRHRSPDHEARFWNLAGFCLRPGYGYPMDDFRIKQIWKVMLADGKRSGKVEPEIQRSVFIRRIAGGLAKGPQQQLFAELAKSDAENRMLQREQLRAMAALEWVDGSRKAKLGETLVTRIAEGRGDGADLWALARIGARRPLRGSVATILPPKVVEPWIEVLLPLLTGDSDDFLFCVQQLAQPTELRELNVTEELQQLAGVETMVPEQEATERIYGEALPVGLKLDN